MGVMEVIGTVIFHPVRMRDALGDRVPQIVQRIGTDKEDVGRIPKLDNHPDVKLSLTGVWGQGRDSPNSLLSQPSPDSRSNMGKPISSNICFSLFSITQKSYLSLTERGITITLWTGKWQGPASDTKLCYTWNNNELKSVAPNCSE